MDLKLNKSSVTDVIGTRGLSAAMLDMTQAGELSTELRRLEHQVVFTNGCFDLLHRGHVDYLTRARGMGDVLFVGLNSDESVRLLKGPGRPILPLDERAVLLAGLRAVDVVVVFHELTAEKLVRAICPHIYVKGGDWGKSGRVPPEAAVVEGCGGRTVYLPYLPGRSTTDILDEIRSAVRPGPVDE